MNNMNFDENTINNLKNMLNNGDLNEVISQIPPEMINNFSSMMKNSNQSTKNNLPNATQNIKKENINNSTVNNTNNNSNTNTNTNTYNNNTNDNNNYYNNSKNENNSNNYNNFKDFDFSKIDMNTILKMKSIMEKLNNSDDSRSNLLYSLKPYLRESRKEKLDQYVNLLNVAKFADLFKNNDKENHT